MTGKLGLVVCIGVLGCGGRVAGDEGERDGSVVADVSASSDTTTVVHDSGVGSVADALPSLPDARDDLGSACFTFPYAPKASECSGAGGHPPEEAGPAGCTYSETCPGRSWAIDCNGDGSCTCILDGKPICNCTMPLPLPYFCDPFGPGERPDADTQPVCCFPHETG